MKAYNKLVRDKILDIIEAQGNKYEIRIADKESIMDYWKQSFKKKLRSF